jgi:hypothetical protein
MTFRQIACIWSLCLASCALLATAARADVAVLVPPRTDQGASGDVGEQSMEELTRLLRSQGFDVISAGQAGAAAEAEQQRGVFPRNYDPMFCITPECANEYRKLFDAPFSVQLSIASKNGRAASVSIVLTEAPRSFFSATALVEGKDVRSAVRSAFEAAREKQRDGAGPWLSVSGVPDGATVYVDNSEFGHVPFQKRRIDPGNHRVEIRADKYVSDVRTLNIAGEIDHVENLVVALKPVGESGYAAHESRHPRRFRRSAWDWALGGALIAVGGAHLIAGIYQKTRDGDCAEQADDGACVKVYGTGSGAARDNLMIGLGAAGVAAGALVMGLGPIGTLGLRANGERALLELKGTF